MLGLACQHIHCGFPLRSIQFPDNYREHKIGSYSIPLVEESDNLLSFYNNQTYSGYHNNVILDGYNGGERFWERVKEAESCGRHLSGCQLQHAGSPHTTDSDSDISRSFVACMNGYAISELMTGPLKIPTDLSSLVGMDQSSEIFRIPFRDLINTKPSEIDIAIHLRLQFDGFEKYQTVNASMYQNEVEKWMSTDTYKNLCTAMSTKVCEILSAKSVIDSQSVNTNKKSYSIYLAADNAIVKQALFNHIQNSIGPSTSSTCQSVHLPLKMMMLNVSSILHTSFIDDPLKINHNISHIKRKMMKKKSKRKKRRKKNKKNKYAESREYATMFDWYMISTANQLLNWARFENRYRYYYSTYTQTSRYLKTISNKTSGGQSDYTLKINGLEAPVWIAKDKLHWG